MTTPKPLSASPLRILNHSFTSIQVDAVDAQEASGGISLTTRRFLRPHREHPRQFMVTLELKFGSQDEEQIAPYFGQIHIEGEFQVADSFPEERVEELVQVTGASILFGACREMLANLTARSTFGMISLPSVSFVEPPTAKKKSAKKKAAPTKKSAKKRT